MHELPLALYTCQQVKTLDQMAMRHYSLLPYELMQRAGHAALAALHHFWHKAHSIAVVCGQGNNGGDGYVVASLAKAKGLHVTVYDISPSNHAHRSIETRQARDEWVDNGGQVLAIPSLFKEDVIVDGLLGTGVHFPVSPEFAQAITAINQSHKPVLALDIPSGLNGDTGAIEGPVVKADVTITFVAMKLGLISHQGNDVVGTLLFDHLGIEDVLISQMEPFACRIEYNNLKKHIPHRALSANKGNQGHVLIIGAGQSQYGGSVCLAGEAALRSGAGLVSVIVAPESLVRSAHAPSELMIAACDKPTEGQALLERATVLLLGPGLSQSVWAEAWFHHVIKSQLPMVVDADGLNWLAKFPQKLPQAILTPHPGEAARLLQTDIKAIQHNRVESAKALQEKYGATIVLKGAGTVIISQQKKINILAGGFPALATGGTGDVLAGIISALLAQKVPANEAACLAVCVHALAAKEQEKKGMLGMIASDLLPTVRLLLNAKEM